MTMDLISAIVGAVTVAVPLLTYIVKRTKTTKDDKVLEWIEKVIPLLPHNAPAPPVRGRVVDHREAPRQG